MKGKTGAIFLLLTGLLVASQVTQAEVYKYRDRSGGLLFTDRPIRQAGYTLLWRSGAGDSGSASSASLQQMKRNRARYSPLIQTVAQQHRLRPELLHAVVRAESAYDPQALSRKGAQGLMQLMPETARRYGAHDSWDPQANLNAGARYLRELLTMFNYNLKLALAAYNAGENAVKRYGNRIPPYPETRDYVRKVLAYYRDNGGGAQPMLR